MIIWDMSPSSERRRWKTNHNGNGKILTVDGNLVKCKNIHKGTWRSPEGKQINQIDYLLIQTK